MKITKCLKKDMPPSIKLDDLICGECRKNCNTDDIYSVNLATNKNNGVSIVLCGNCARELQMEINLVINKA